LGPRALRPGTASLLVLLSVLLAGCGGGGGSLAAAPTALPERMTPEGYLGLHFVREPLAEREFAKAGSDALISQGQMYSVREGSTVQGTLEAAVFERRVNSRLLKVRDQVEAGLGGGFSTRRFGTLQVRVAVRGQQKVYLWFPPDRDAMMLLVMRGEYEHPDQAALGILAYANGLELDQIADALAMED
jgi:hypothetical protein